MIDLKKFCADDRYQLSEPWSVDQYTYASNGHVLVRVARRDDAPEKENALNVAQLWEAFDEKADFVGLPKTPAFTVTRCLHCRGSGAVVQCIECDGEGTLECDLGHDHECEECQGEGEQPATLIENEGSKPCDECGGEGRIPDLDKGFSAGVALPNGVSITLKYLILLNSLPGIRWNLNEGLEQAPIHFVFDGGAGLLMKPIPAHTAT